MRINTSANASISIALLSLSGHRTAKYYRDAVSRQFPKITAANKNQAYSFGASLIEKDLPAADAIYDRRLNEFGATLVAGTGIPAPKVDLDWAKVIYDKDAIRTHFKALNAESDPILFKMEQKANAMRAEVINFANRLASSLRIEHDAAAKRHSKKK